MPFSRSISSAAARYGQQATNISQNATANISNIMMGIAQIKAQGIREGSQAWTNALQQLGVTVQNWPIIKAQIEEQKYQRTVGRPMQEAIGKAQLEHIVAQTAELESQTGERKENSKGYADWLGWATNGRKGPIPPGAEKFEAAYQDTSNKARANLANANKAEYDAAIASWDAAHKIASASVARLESYPEDTDETTLRADIANTFKKIRKETPGVLPEGLTPQPDWFTLSHLKVFAEEARIRAGVKREEPPKSELTAEQKEFEAAYSNYLEAEGLPRNAKNERIYRKKFWPIEKGTRTGEELTAGIKEYEFAVSQGFKGTFEEWKKKETPETVEMRALRLELLRTQVEQAKGRQAGMTSADARGVLSNVRMIAQSIKNAWASDDPRKDLPIEQIMESVAQELGTSMDELSQAMLKKGEQGTTSQGAIKIIRDAEGRIVGVE